MPQVPTHASQIAKVAHSPSFRTEGFKPRLGRRDDLDPGGLAAHDRFDHAAFLNTVHLARNAVAAADFLGFLASGFLRLVLGLLLGRLRNAREKGHARQTRLRVGRLGAIRSLDEEGDPITAIFGTGLPANVSWSFLFRVAYRRAGDNVSRRRSKSCRSFHIVEGGYLRTITPRTPWVRINERDDRTADGMFFTAHDESGRLRERKVKFHYVSGFVPWNHDALLLGRIRRISDLELDGFSVLPLILKKSHSGAARVDTRHDPIQRHRLARTVDFPFGRDPWKVFSFEWGW